MVIDTPGRWGKGVSEHKEKQENWKEHTGRNGFANHLNENPGSWDKRGH